MTTEMMANEKVMEIMRLAGVLPRDYEHCARNYEALSDADLDARLNRLQHGKSKLDAWRKRRDDLEAEAAARRDGLIAPKLSQLSRLKSAIDRHLHDLQAMIDRLERWQPSLPAEVTAQIAGQIENLAALHKQLLGGETPFRALINDATLAPTPSDADTAKALEVIEWMLNANQRFEAVSKGVSRQMEALIHHPLLLSGEARLTDVATIDAIARLENSILTQRPDMIVALNEEGSSIGRLVKHHLGIEVPIVTVYGTAETDITVDGLFDRSASWNRICVVGHVTRTGATMLKTVGLLQHVYHPGMIFSAALASSINAVELLAGGRNAFLYHQLSGAGDIDLGFNAGKGVVIKEDRYIIGGDAGAPGTIEVGMADLKARREHFDGIYPTDTVR